MALMDAYGLSLVSVQVWGLLWGVLSAFVIAGGLVVARVGPRQQPGAHAAAGQRGAVVGHRAVPDPQLDRPAGRGMAVFMLLMPFAEAAEQTVLQKVVPFERQGRVFGFAQSVEQAASPLTAFLIGPDRAVRRHPVHDRRRGRGRRSAPGSAPAPTAGWPWSSW